MTRKEWMIWVIVTLLSSSNARPQTAAGDDWILTSTDLPTDHDLPRLMPSLGNGHLAVNVLLPPLAEEPPTIFVNCLYNGDTWNSHRARIPNYANLFMYASDPNLPRYYQLDLKRAIFSTILGSEDGLRVEQQVFAHRRFTRTILNVVTATMGGKTSEVNDTRSPVQIDFGIECGLQSQDISLSETKTIDLSGEVNNRLGIDKIWYRCEHTTIVESPQDQSEPIQVCFAWIEPWDLGMTIDDPAEPQQQQRVFVTIVDNSLEAVLEELHLLMEHTASELVDLHAEAWSSIWNAGRVEVTAAKVGGQSDDAFELSRVVVASQYYLLSSLPFPDLSMRPLPEFCGLSPGMNKNLFKIR